MRTSRPKPPPRTPRRWRTPPPLLRGNEPLEGMDMLREVGGDTGLLLWQSYRNVMLWATADEGEREKMFSAAASKKRLESVLASDVPAEVREPLLGVGRLLGAPGGTPGAQVADACHALAEWAGAQNATATALAFTQAAALADPTAAEMAYRVGQIARRRGDMARAETWFRHAIMVGRQNGDWSSYSLAYIALGNMLLGRGNYPGAHRMHVKALRAARRKGLPRIQGMALHDLFVIATETNRVSQAEEYARQAMRAYGAEHPSVPMLAHDVAYFWMNQGHFARAVGVFQALTPHFERDAVRHILNLAHQARAAGGAGDRNLFRRMWTETWRLAREPEAAERAADVYLELAQGASSLGEWDRAEQAAERALETARERGDNVTLVRVEWVLDEVRAGRQAEKNRNAAEQPEIARTADHLAEEFIHSLTTVGAGV